MDKTYEWHKIAESRAELRLEVNGLVEVEVAGKKLCIAAFNDILSACTAKCPHAGGTLAAGYLDAVGNIVCPLHRYKFNPASGRNVTGEGYFLKTFPVEVREEGVFVGLAQNKFTAN